MSIGQRLMNLRKEKQLSQEEVASELNVSRQTVSKWETDQSLPDFDKIVPLCNLFEISTDELLKGEKKESENTSIKQVANHSNALAVCIAIFLYFLSIIWIALAQALDVNDEFSVCIFLLFCAIGTIILIYNGMTKSQEKKVLKKPTPLFQGMVVITFMIFLILYLLISFLTKAWHITWIIWLIFIVVLNIIKLVFDLRGEKHEK